LFFSKVLLTAGALKPEPYVIVRIDRLFSPEVEAKVFPMPAIYKVSTNGLEYVTIVEIADTSKATAFAPIKAALAATELSKINQPSAETLIWNTEDLDSLPANLETPNWEDQGIRVWVVKKPD
jgi:hypothetical protein